MVGLETRAKVLEKEKYRKKFFDRSKKCPKKPT